MERRALRAPGFVPVEAKLSAPAVGDGLVLRPAVVDRLLDSGDPPVVVVTGPPGYGKTVAVSQWSEEDERPFAWLSLDDADNDPVVLLTYLVLALHRIEPADPGIIADLDQDDASLASVLPRLGRMLRWRRRPFVLVLDGVDALTASPARRVLRTLIDNVRDGWKLVLVGRAMPDPIADPQHAAGEVVSVGPDDLRLGRPETVALLKAAGVRLPPRDVDRLLERTEGWAAPTYLAALGLSAHDRPERFVDTVAGDDAVISGYIRDEVVAGLLPEDRAFLTHVSILGRLSAPLCDAVVGRTDSADVLRRLADSSALLVPLDRDRAWFRLNRLLAGALLAELRRDEASLVPTLHARASRWLEENGEHDEAIEHAIAAGDLEWTARLMWSRTAERVETGHVHVLEEWLGRLPPVKVAAYAKLALTAAWCAVERGEPADHWLSAVQRGRYDATLKREAASVSAGAALLRAALARHGVARMGEDARLAARLLARDDRWLLTAGLFDALSTHLSGNGDEGCYRLEAVERQAAVSDAHRTRAVALTQLTLAAIDREDWQSAAKLAEIARALVRRHTLGDVVPNAIVYPVSAVVAAYDGRVEEAARTARHCAAAIALRDHPAVWRRAQSRRALAQAMLILGDGAAARVLLSQARELLLGAPDAVVLREAVDRLWRRLESMPVDAETGASALTGAELRVLQYLPTHLSFEEIGRHLFVSRNTVKTQAVAAYRKLGVSSRTEAVERAYALGLIAR